MSVEINDIVGYALQVIQDVEVLLGPGKGVEKRAKAVDLVTVGLDAYLEAKGVKVDKAAILSDLTALIEMAVKTYNDLGVFPKVV